MIERQRGAVLVWVLLCALVGGVFAASLSPPIYRSEGLIRFPEPTGPVDVQALCPWRRSSATLLSESLLTPRFAELAVRQPAWRDAGGYHGPCAVAEFQARCRLVPEPATRSVHVFFEDSRPGVAQAGVHSLLSAYEQERARLAIPSEESKRLAAVMEAKASKLRAEVGERERRLGCLLCDYGDVAGVEAAHGMAVHGAHQAERDLARVQEMVDLGEAPAGTTPSEFEALRRVLAERSAEAHRAVKAIQATRREVVQLIFEQEEARRELESLAVYLDRDDEAYSVRPAFVVEERGTLPSRPIRQPRGVHAGLGILAGASLGLLLAGLLGRRA